MSTEFRSDASGELGFVRWWGGDAKGVCYEFGTISNYETVLNWLRSGDKFNPDTDYNMSTDPQTADDLEDLMAAGSATLGDFPVTVELGSGDYMTFTEER